MKFTPTNQVSNWIIDDCLSHHAQIPPLWLTQVKHIHEITEFSNKPSILFHLVLICRNTRLHLFHSSFWTHKTFNLLFKRRHTFSEEMNFNTQHVLKGIVSVDKLFLRIFVDWTLNHLKARMRRKTHYLSMHQNLLCYLCCFNGFQGRFHYHRNIIK